MNKISAIGLRSSTDITMMRLYRIYHALIHGNTNGIYNSDSLLIFFSPNVRLSRVYVQSIPIQFTDGIIFAF